jgi:hypothetical protein
MSAAMRRKLAAQMEAEKAQEAVLTQARKEAYNARLSLRMLHAGHLNPAAASVPAAAVAESTGRRSPPLPAQDRSARPASAAAPTRAPAVTDAGVPRVREAVQSQRAAEQAQYELQLEQARKEFYHARKDAVAKGKVYQGLDDASEGTAAATGSRGTAPAPTRPSITDAGMPTNARRRPQGLPRTPPQGSSEEGSAAFSRGRGDDVASNYDAVEIDEPRAAPAKGPVSAPVPTLSAVEALDIGNDGMTMQQRLRAKRIAMEQAEYEEQLKAARIAHFQARKEASIRSKQL